MQNFICILLLSWPGHCESDKIKRMITLAVIPLSGLHCTTTTTYYTTYDQI